MRIFLICQQARRPHAVPAYAFWEYYFKAALAEAGHSVVEATDVDWAEGLTLMPAEDRQRWLDRTWTQTIATIKQEHARRPLGLVLSYLFPLQVEPAAVTAIRALGVPCVNFFCDNVREFSRVPDCYRPFDLHWVPEFDACSLYRTAALPFVHAPMPVWTPPELRTVPEEKNADCVFIGSQDVLRQELLGDAVALGLSLRIFGDGWRPAGPFTPQPPTPGRTIANQFAFLRDHGLRGVAMRATYQLRRSQPDGWVDSVWQPSLKGEHYFRTTRESQLVIGINRYPSFRHPFSKPGRYSRLRDIEAPMLGACYVTEWAPGLDRLYDLEKEIVTYRGAAELVQKANQLRADRPKRESLRRLGQRRALSDHTLSRSLQGIFEKLGLSA